MLSKVRRAVSLQYVGGGRVFAFVLFDNCILNGRDTLAASTFLRSDLWEGLVSGLVLCDWTGASWSVCLVFGFCELSGRCWMYLFDALQSACEVWFSLRGEDLRNL